MVAATVGIGFVSMAVWAHHMFTVGMNSYANAFFTLTTMVVGVPTGIKIFNWIGTMWGGKILFKSPMLFCIAFLFQFLVAGLTGIMLSAAPFDWQLGNSYFVVAHFHYVIVEHSLRAIRSLLLLVSKMTGRMYNETLGKWHFGSSYRFSSDLRFHAYPRFAGNAAPHYTYEPGRGWEIWNLIVTIGVFSNCRDFSVCRICCGLASRARSPATIRGMRGR
jgi:cytochrome c oxidase subunit 1